jgi:hypothetical protein
MLCQQLYHLYDWLPVFLTGITFGRAPGRCDVVVVSVALMLTVVLRYC